MRGLTSGERMFALLEVFRPFSKLCRFGFAPDVTALVLSILGLVPAAFFGPAPLL
ncbi:hypothetical protein RB2654_19023 [Maritimibacter alkaliphilus HTCC2654]|uniref:Uncharacterized protein n=2 Tax=Maritimibacter alkaliphilus HTCC2654 TaxID=314271 RepID=A3V9W5_9RHOB|nr:hypothetical protein RB2654_19023 [Maritimibacter alkaliphilus HTCC2654]